MATYTSNYGWTKPSGSDNVDISVLNNNLDDQDSTIHDAFLNMAPLFSELSTYAVDDIVLYEKKLYKCHTAVVTPGSWTGSTNWQVYKLSEGGGGGLTLGETSSTAYRGDRGKTAYNHSQTTGNPHGTTASDVGLGNVPNVSTNDQTPTFSEASTRNNIASGEKLSVIFGKIQKFFNDLKSVAYSGSYNDLTNKPTIPDELADLTADSTHRVVTDAQISTWNGKSDFSGNYTGLTNKPQINSVELSGNKTTSDLGINADNVMMSDGTTSVEDAVDELALSQMNPLSHNGIYTGRNLGTINNASDWAAFREEYGIADKSYKGLYLGDYVKVNDGTYNADWMVAGFNTETNKGSTNILGECVSMIPRVGNGCGTSYMNSTNVTTGGYKDSYMNTTKLPDVATKLTTIFGSNLVTRDILVSNTVTNGYASDWDWISCKCSLLTSVQVYGSLSFENTGGTYFAGYNIGEGCEKLPVFNFINPVQFARAHFWLRGVSSASGFCYVSYSGNANGDGGASSALGVRPLICLN